MKLVRSFLLAAVLAMATPALAAPTAGKDYLVLNPPQPTTAPDKVEVIEFFWYGCPHCFDLHPHLNQWKRQKPQDVQLRYVPVVFPDRQGVPRPTWVAGAKIFYALEALGELDRLNDAVYEAIHVDQIDLLGNEQVLFDWMAKKGVDRKKFADTYGSFGVQGKVSRAMQITRDYQLRGVPTVVVEGRYLTSGTYTGSPQNTVSVMDQLIKKAREERVSKR
ncbi:MAG TPA: thiol:disulfide interchange protein DsbA/DsbL [Pelomicrobium sp.]|nr:thiol:disulfide interchange protein DsbA/DsbL [Pelomicrobium sp.]